MVDQALLGGPTEVTTIAERGNTLESKHKTPLGTEEVIALTTQHPHKQMACGFA